MTKVAGRNLPNGIKAGTAKDGRQIRIWFELESQHIRIEVMLPKGKQWLVTMVPMARVSSWEPA